MPLATPHDPKTLDQRKPQKCSITAVNITRFTFTSCASNFRTILIRSASHLSIAWPPILDNVRSLLAMSRYVFADFSYAAIRLRALAKYCFVSSAWEKGPFSSGDIRSSPRSAHLCLNSARLKAPVCEQPPFQNPAVVYRDHNGELRHGVDLPRVQASDELLRSRNIVDTVVVVVEVKEESVGFPERSL